MWMKLVSSAETPVSTSGYTGIHLKYAGYTNGFESGEYITAEWYDGSDWHIADQIISNGSWTYRDITLPSGAANNPNFKIRLSTNSNKNTEWARMDAVEVTGSP
jgi:hypothetical protein